MSGKFLYNYLTGELDIADDSKIDNVTWGEKLLTLKPAYKPKPKASKSEKFKYESWADGLEERTRPAKKAPVKIVKKPTPIKYTGKKPCIIIYYSNGAIEIETTDTKWLQELKEKNLID